MTIEARGQALADAGYVVHENTSTLVVDVDPDITSDDYYWTGRSGQGHNPTDHQIVSPADGRSTAEAQAEQGGAGWNREAGVGVSDTPDESWRNDDLRSYAEEQGIEVSSQANKAELLAAIRGE